jgi:hypothetical protein
MVLARQTSAPTSPGLETPKGTEPHGRSRPYPTLRVLHLRATSIAATISIVIAITTAPSSLGTGGRAIERGNAGGRQLSAERPAPPRFGEVNREVQTRECPGGRARLEHMLICKFADLQICSIEPNPKGDLRRGTPASAGYTASRTHQLRGSVSIRGTTWVEVDQSQGRGEARS